MGIPRDTYTEIIGKGKSDKINHAYAFGSVDMEGFKDIVDAAGSIDVNNDLEFSLEGRYFQKGNIRLTGDHALAFTRMRKEDPRGDFERQMRQRQVIQAVIKKDASFSSLSNYGDVLTAIQKNMKTNLTQDQIFDLPKNYKKLSAEQ